MVSDGKGDEPPGLLEMVPAFLLAALALLFGPPIEAAMAFISLSASNEGDASGYNVAPIVCAWAGGLLLWSGAYLAIRFRSDWSRYAGKWGRWCTWWTLLSVITVFPVILFALAFGTEPSQQIMQDPKTGRFAFPAHFIQAFCPSACRWLAVAVALCAPRWAAHHAARISVGAYLISLTVFVFLLV